MHKDLHTIDLHMTIRTFNTRIILSNKIFLKKLVIQFSIVFFKTFVDKCDEMCNEISSIMLFKSSKLYKNINTADK